MGEMVPVVLGALAGLAALFVAVRWRALAFALLCAAAGVIASYVNGELSVWWGFISFDTLLAFISGAVVYFAAGYLRLYAVQMNWITRERPKVGRVGCAWLIRRFVDPDAAFFFANSAAFAAETARLAATPFHVEGSGLERQGDQSSFEVVLARYDLTNDPALVLLGQIVNVADVPRSQLPRLEGHGLRATIDGLLLIYTDDQTVLAEGGTIFEALYAYCRRQVELGRN